MTILFMASKKTFSRSTLFMNDPFSFVGNEVGQAICKKAIGNRED
jgi:hypothetical protein